MNNIYIIDDDLFEEINLIFNKDGNTFILNNNIYTFVFTDYNCIEIKWNDFNIQKFITTDSYLLIYYAK